MRWFWAVRRALAKTLHWSLSTTRSVREWSEVSPAQMLGRFNGWVKKPSSASMRRARLGRGGSVGFYDHSKTYIAAPPDVLRVDEKHLREVSVFNVLGMIITTNHRTNGIISG